MSDSKERSDDSQARPSDSAGHSDGEQAASGGAHAHSKACLDLAERLSEYLDGELPADLEAQVEAHNAECANCERFVESLRRTKQLAHLMRHHGLSSSTLERLAAEARKRLGL